MNGTHRTRRLAALLTTLAALTPLARAGDNPELVSVNLSGGAAGTAFQPRISADGRYVVFESWGSNLVPGGTTAVARVYVRDLLLQQTEACSVNAAGALANGPAHDPSLTADARFVTFLSAAPNMLDGFPHLFLRDRVAGTTTVLEAEGQDCQLSEDGALAFTDTPAGQVFATHLATGQLEPISVDDLGTPANGPSKLGTRQCVSADGRFVVFNSEATNLVPGLTVPNLLVYVRDRSLGTTRLVSATSAGEPADLGCLGESISADGRFVAFSSYAKNLSDLPPFSKAQTYVRDLLTGELELVSVSNAGEPCMGRSPYTSAWSTSISGDGRFVAFPSTTDSGLTNTKIVLLVRDRLAGLTYAVSFDQQGTPRHGLDPMLSRDGRTVAFWSNESLVPQDTNGTGGDVYRVDRLPWDEIEAGLAGMAGEPRLVVQGAPEAQAPILLAITHLRPGAVAQLVLGFAQVNQPFKGGVLVPEPALVLPLPMDTQGMCVLSTRFPAGVPSGTPLCLQAWVPDAAGPAGFAATNAVAHVAQ